jgi:tyrosyl-tRNA synthetase
VRQNAVRINDERVSDDKMKVTGKSFQSGRLTLRAGKKKVRRVVLG